MASPSCTAITAWFPLGRRLQVFGPRGRLPIWGGWREGSRDWRGSLRCRLPGISSRMAPRHVGAHSRWVRMGVHPGLVAWGTWLRRAGWNGGGSCTLAADSEMLLSLPYPSLSGGRRRHHTFVTLYAVAARLIAFLPLLKQVTQASTAFSGARRFSVCSERR